MKVKFKYINVQEMIRKKVVRSGGSGAVWVPVRWLGKEVIVILSKKGKE